MYYEDLDLGWRARLAGYSAEYVRASVVHHKWHGSSSRHGRAWLEVISCVNRQRTLLKNASVPFILRTTPRTALELGKIVWFGRLKGILQSARAVRESMGLRPNVQAMAKVTRRQVEAEWTEDPA
jgi:GT2 family glycosyltransferase